MTWREDLRSLGECRDCEAPLLASERNHTRCGVCRAKRAVAKGRQRGYAPASMTRVEARMQEAIQVRIEVIGYDDGAGDREAVRRRRAAGGVSGRKCGAAQPERRSDVDDVNGNLTASTATGAAPVSEPPLPERRRPLRALPKTAGFLLSAVLLAVSPGTAASGKPLSADLLAGSPRSGASGQTFRDCPECPEMVVVPSGSFEMGSPGSEKDRWRHEGPVHRVTFARPFAVGVYEVTFDEWDACVSGGGCGGYRPDAEGWGRGSRPVINVGWKGAQSYVRWLSGETGKEYRLLSESEWEYAARGGTRTRYWWGDAIGRNRANCDGCGSQWDAKQTSPVGAFAANGFGLYDVHGNVWEWVEDCYDDSYHGAPGDGSARQSGMCGHRVLRGGSWYNGPRHLRSADRLRGAAWFQNFNVGFRVAKTLD